jgi:hypothetical protein
MNLEELVALQGKQIKLLTGIVKRQRDHLVKLSQKDDPYHYGFDGMDEEINTLNFLIKE